MIMANDTDGDTLTYAPATINTGKGTVTVNTTAGTFSYSPAAARHQASAVGAPASDKQDTFTINVDDAPTAV